MRAGEVLHLITDTTSLTVGNGAVWSVGSAVRGLGGQGPPRGWG